jgi:hypothetical protein
MEVVFLSLPVLWTQANAMQARYSYLQDLESKVEVFRFRRLEL